MPGRSIGSINPGDVDAKIADRAARRINEYLEGHPDDDLYRFQSHREADMTLRIRMCRRLPAMHKRRV